MKTFDGKIKFAHIGIYTVTFTLISIVSAITDGVSRDPGHETDVRSLQKLCGIREIATGSSALRRSEKPTQKTTTYIVGGRDAKPEDWPWMARILKIDPESKKNTFKLLCGGSIISRRYILTAAHCFSPVPAPMENYTVERFTFGRENQEPVRVERVVMHPDYSPYSLYNDLAIVRLRTPLQQPFMSVCLPKPHYAKYSLANKTASVIGYGSLTFGGPVSEKLREATFPIQSNLRCQQTYDNLKSEHLQDGIIASQMCAGSLHGGSDSCQGDSGGPLMILDSENKWTVVGIVSFGHNCGSPGYPGVYTRVSSFFNFIADNVDFSL